MHNDYCFLERHLLITDTDLLLIVVTVNLDNELGSINAFNKKNIMSF